MKMEKDARMPRIIFPPGLSGTFLHLLISAALVVHLLPYPPATLTAVYRSRFFLLLQRRTAPSGHRQFQCDPAAHADFL